MRNLTGIAQNGDEKSYHAIKVKIILIGASIDVLRHDEF